jgi:hypothetical protein
MRRRAIVRLVMGAIALAVALTCAGETIAARAIPTVSVMLSDRSFRVTPPILHSGTTVFVVRNTGKKGHAFAVSGPGVKSSHTTTLKSGASAKLTVTLRSGTYMLSDPVGLGAYSVQYVNVVPATSLTGKGGTNVVGSDPSTGAMCGGTYTP